ncbi:SCO2322 family protein [Streptomyces sp. NBRC 109706]|uniref:SCO2322 family protein n=1 Tax=Streptomyces sp. NBRC 109706 TaxID=1550035 RepID=UPI00082EAFA4|nr:SCO2322 family protein [Streptomyces sp. NBRC 109706]
MSRGVGRLLLTLVLALGALWPAPSALAEEQAYRYWSFWTWAADDAEWEYADQGPGTLRPSDGAVVGFRFGVSGEADDRTAPRGETDVARVCGPAAEEPHVVLVLDFGTEADAPGDAMPPAAREECVGLPSGATVAELLAEAAPPLRYDQAGLLCGIAGYPERGCGEAVADEGSGGGSSAGVPLLVGVGLVALLGAAGLVRARRRRG